MGILSGVRVVEVAVFGFVPATGAVLSDWGADVIKVEHPVHGDVMRGMSFNGVVPATNRSSVLFEVFNRGKRSVGVDLSTPEGPELILRLVDHADVFITSLLTPALLRYGIDAETVTRRNPQIVYARGTGQGLFGPDADKGGFDLLSYWARSGAMLAGKPADAQSPGTTPSTAYGDIQAGLMLAGGIAAALYQRERTGVGTVVDTSLFGAGLWAMQPSLAGAFVSGVDNLPAWDRRRPWNILVNTYATADGRDIFLAMPEFDRHWPGLCRALGREDLANDPVFTDGARRSENTEACVRVLDDTFARRSLVDWRVALASQDGPWGVSQTAREAIHDEQAVANDLVRWLDLGDDFALPVVATPVQFAEHQQTLTPAPHLGEHTDEVFLDVGLSWDDLLSFKIAGAMF